MANREGMVAGTEEKAALGPRDTSVSDSSTMETSRVIYLAAAEEPCRIKVEPPETCGGGGGHPSRFGLYSAPSAKWQSLGIKV